MKTPLHFFLKLFLLLFNLNAHQGYASGIPDELTINQWRCGKVATAPLAEWARAGLQGDAEETFYKDLSAKQRADFDMTCTLPGVIRDILIRQAGVLITPEMSIPERLDCVRAIVRLPDSKRPDVLFGMIDFMRECPTWEKRGQILLHCLAHEEAQRASQLFKKLIGNIFSTLPAGSSFATLSEILQIAMKNKVTIQFHAFVRTNSITDLKVMAVLAQTTDADDFPIIAAELFS